MLMYIWVISDQSLSYNEEQWSLKNGVLNKLELQP